MAPMASFRGLVARAAHWRLREWGRGKTACSLRGQHGRTLYRLQGRLLCKTRYPAPAGVAGERTVVYQSALRAGLIAGNWA